MNGTSHCIPLPNGATQSFIIRRRKYDFTFSDCIDNLGVPRSVGYGKLVILIGIAAKAG